MIGELSFFGIYIPSLLMLTLIALAAARGLSFVLAQLGFYRLVWHRTLFDFALFILILGACSFCSTI